MTALFEASQSLRWELRTHVQDVILNAECNSDGTEQSFLGYVTDGIDGKYSELRWEEPKLANEVIQFFADNGVQY